MVTDKDILLKIKEKLIAQGKPAYKMYQSEWTDELEEEIGSCAYFNEAGNRCAVGHIIDPAYYDYEIEQNEAKRTIKLLKPEFVSSIEEELRNVFK